MKIATSLGGSVTDATSLGGSAMVGGLVKRVYLLSIIPRTVFDFKEAVFFDAEPKTRCAFPKKSLPQTQSLEQSSERIEDSW